MFKLFVSSTFRDIGDGRENIRQSLTNLLDVVGMEGFTPSEKTSHETCIRKLNECQIYLLLIGYKYGSSLECQIRDMGITTCGKDPKKDCNEISYTQCEYKNAVGNDMPRIAIFLDGEFLNFVGTVRTGERGPKEEKKLEKFKEEIEKTETCKTITIKTKEEWNHLGENIRKYLDENIWNWVFEKKLDISDFFGRVKDLRDLKEKFERSSIICINGVGGIGKTSLIQVFLLLMRFKVDNIYVLMKNSERYKDTEVGYRPARGKFKEGSYSEKFDLSDISRLVLNLTEKKVYYASET